jgi:Cytidylate kinase-like family
MLIKREEVGVARICMVISTVNPNICGIDGQMYPEAFLSAEDYWRTADRIVRAAAARGHVVIVGRASQVILADLHDVLHVRVIAPFEKRVAYVMQRDGVDRHTATSRIHTKDFAALSLAPWTAWIIGVLFVLVNGWTLLQNRTFRL